MKITEEIKKEIAKEARRVLAGHYNVMPKDIDIAILEGNDKLHDEWITLCENALALIEKEVA